MTVPIQAPDRSVCQKFNIHGLLDATNQIARHVPVQIVAPNDEQNFFACCARNTAAWPAELPPPTTITVQPSQRCPSAGVAA